MGKFVNKLWMIITACVISIIIISLNAYLLFQTFREWF